MKITYKGKPYTIELVEKFGHIKNSCYEFSCKIYNEKGKEFTGIIISDGWDYPLEDSLEFHFETCTICGNEEKEYQGNCEICNDWKMD